MEDEEVQFEVSRWRWGGVEGEQFEVNGLEVKAEGV